MPLKDAEINETNINEIQINYAAINNTGRLQELSATRLLN